MVTDVYEKELDAEEAHDLLVQFGNKETHDNNFPNCDCMGVRE